MKKISFCISLLFFLTACGDPSFHKHDNVITITEVVDVDVEEDKPVEVDEENAAVDEQDTVQLDEPVAPEPEFVTVKGERQQLRVGPNREKDPIYKPDGSNAKCPDDGAKLELLGESGGYYKVRFDGRELYINKQSCIK